MNRREFALTTTALALTGAAPLTWAQAPVEGKDYKRVAQPVPMPAGKVDVVEFFGYWCPHCNEFEPTLDAWVRKLPAAQVNFRRIPVVFRPSNEPLQRLYYAFEALGLVDSLHRKTFHAVHVENRRLDNDAEIGKWLQTVGADSAKVLDTMKSFSVATKARQGKQQAEAFGIDGVPTLGIAGRWMTSPSIAGTPERALAVCDALIAQARKG
jgi:thiol:disulfide interchange protein DsbA